MRQRTYKTKAETEAKKPVTATIVLTLLFISVVVPMLQYWGECAGVSAGVLHAAGVGPSRWALPEVLGWNRSSVRRRPTGVHAPSAPAGYTNKD